MKVIAYGYKFLNDKKIRLWFYGDGHIMTKVDGEQFTEYVGEPDFLDSLNILDFTLFERYFSAWDD